MKNIWSWSRTSGRGASLRRFTNTTPARRPCHFLSRSSSPGRSRVPSHAPIVGPTETRLARGVETPPAGAPGSRAEREGPGVTRHPGPCTDGSPAPEVGAPPSAPPRPEPQIPAGDWGEAGGRLGSRSVRVGSPSAVGGGPARPRPSRPVPAPLRAPPPPSPQPPPPVPAPQHKLSVPLAPSSAPGASRSSPAHSAHSGQPPPHDPPSPAPLFAPSGPAEPPGRSAPARSDQAQAAQWAQAQSPEPRATSTIASNSWNASNSPGEAREDGPEGLDKGLDNDAEGVWSPDIEQSFQEALAIYPPCGRRKIILSDEGKMYGRNELIARYIKLRTGKTRTRKQVSSHIQVLARKKVREYQVGIKAMNLDQVSKDKALQSMASMSSAQIVSASVLQNKFSPPSPLPQAVFSTSSRFWSSPPLLGQQPGPSQDIKPFAQPAYPVQPPLPPTLSSYEPLAPLPSAAASVPVWQDRTIASSRLRLLEYSAFMEVQRDPDTYSKHLFVHIGQTNPAFSDPPLEAVDVRQIYDKFPEKKGGLKELYEKGPPNAFFLVKFWADLNSTIQEGPGAFYGVSSQYSSADSMTISVSTKVCSFGKQVVEKVETEYARLENGRFVYRIHRSPMCEYMINFIHKLKHLPEKYMMNSVLENFTILQVVTSRDSQETLLVIAFVFEVSTSEHGAQHHVYKLVKD
ncbi:transcriptional enhancer factor TEF-5 [Eubalaena glacialis]|nr:transcriptional enhancer factor TEF-5 [Eubalaena glacialis]